MFQPRPWLNLLLWHQNHGVDLSKKEQDRKLIFCAPERGGGRKLIKLPEAAPSDWKLYDQTNSLRLARACVEVDADNETEEEIKVDIGTLWNKWWRGYSSNSYKRLWASWDKGDGDSWLCSTGEEKRGTISRIYTKSRWPDLSWRRWTQSTALSTFKPVPSNCCRVLWVELKEAEFHLELVVM